MRKKTCKMGESAKMSGMFDAERLRHLRAMAKLSQRELADRAGCSPNEISRYERGDIAPREERVIMLAKALGAKPESLHADGPMIHDAITTRILELLDSLSESGRAMALAEVARIAESKRQAEPPVPPRSIGGPKK